MLLNYKGMLYLGILVIAILGTQLIIDKRVKESIDHTMLVKERDNLRRTFESSTQIKNIQDMNITPSGVIDCVSCDVNITI
jgi:hypothetical protein